MSKRIQIHRGDAYRHKNGDVYVVHGILYTPEINSGNNSPFNTLTTLRLRRKRDGVLVDRPAATVINEIQKGNLMLSTSDSVKTMEFNMILEKGLIGIVTAT